MRFWTGWILGLGIMLLALVWGFSQWNLRYYSDYIGERLELLAELRRGALQEYFSTAEAEVRFWSKNPQIVSAQQQLNAIWQEGGEGLARDLQSHYIHNNPSPAGFLLNLDDAGDGSEYSLLHARMHPVARLFVTHRGYYDLFLIGTEGDVYYSVEKEADFGTNLLSGPWKESGLAEVFVAARNGQQSKVLAISDMQAYGPSDGAPAIFVASALHDEEGQFIGVMALQLPTDRILGIMNYVAGMGDTGETYLVGEDLLMRSQSRFAETSSLLTQRVDTEAVERALAGEQGRVAILDYRGVPVLSGFTPVNIGGHQWVVLAEMDQTEVAQFAAAQRPPIAGALILIYGLSLWSVWYWRGRRMPEEQLAMHDISLAEAGSGGDMGS